MLSNYADAQTVQAFFVGKIKVVKNIYGSNAHMWYRIHSLHAKLFSSFIQAVSGILHLSFWLNKYGDKQNSASYSTCNKIHLFFLVRRIDILKLMLCFTSVQCYGCFAHIRYCISYRNHVLWLHNWLNISTC